jgi:hypothetical protein
MYYSAFKARPWSSNHTCMAIAGWRDCIECVVVENTYIETDLDVFVF